MPAGEVALGKPADWPTYGWDNEYGQRRFAVRAFRASRQLVRCGPLRFWVGPGCGRWRWLGQPRLRHAASVLFSTSSLSCGEDAAAAR